MILVVVECEGLHERVVFLTNDVGQVSSLLSENECFDLFGLAEFEYLFVRLDKRH